MHRKTVRLFPRETIGDTINANEKLVELWGGPHDGSIEKVTGTAETVVKDNEWYQPSQPGDFAMNRFRHVSVKS